MRSFTSLFYLVALFCCQNSNAQIWKKYADSIPYYKDQKNNERVFQLVSLVTSELKKDSASTLTYASYLYQLGGLYYYKNKYDSAETLLLQAKAVREKISGKHGADYARTCSYLAVLYENLRRFDEAEAMFLLSKHVQKEIDSLSLPYALSCYNLGIFYIQSLESARAVLQIQEARVLFEKLLPKNHPYHIQSTSDLAVAYAQIGDYAKAEQLDVEIKDFRESQHGKLNAEYVGSCNNLGEIYRNSGQYKKAEPILGEAREILQTINDKNSREYAQACNNLGLLYFQEGEYEKAEPLMLEAMQVREDILQKNDRDYPKSFNNLGIFYMNMGQYEKAEKYFLHAIDLMEKAGANQDQPFAYTCSNLGDLYQRRGLYSKAEALFQQAKEILSKNPGENSPDFAKICDNLGLIYTELSEYEKANMFLLKARAIFLKNQEGDSPEYAGNCNNIGLLYMNESEFAKAEPFLLEAKQISEKTLGKNSNVYANDCNNLGRINWNEGNWQKAGEYFREVIHSQQEQVKQIFEFTNEVEKQSYLKNAEDYRNFFFSFCTATKVPAFNKDLYDICISGRNTILSSLLQLGEAIRNASDSTLSDTYQQWQDTREQLAFWFSKPVGERKGTDSLLEKKANMLEKQLVKGSGDFRANLQKKQVKWNDIREKLQPGEAAIEFTVFNYFDGKRYTDSNFYAALILRYDEPGPELVELFEEKQLNKILSASRGAAHEQVKLLYKRGVKPSRLNPTIAYGSLYDLIWKPLESHLQGVRKIYFAPAGILYKISIAALEIKKDSLLSDQYQFVQLSTTASIAEQKTAILITSTIRIRLYGGINYDEDSDKLKTIARQYHITDKLSAAMPVNITRGATWDYLPGTLAEIDGIYKMAARKKMAISVLAGDSATEESFKALKGKNSPGIIHIATHGLFFPEPSKKIKNDSSGIAEYENVFSQSNNPLLRSAILFAGANNFWKGKPIEGIDDGILTAYEVSNEFLPATRLVVLSACETGLGDIQGTEGVYGLQRAFKMAGVQYLLMSLWQVPDNETAEFMQAFYQHLFDHYSIENAFHHAQTLMKNKYRQDPFKWAAWILVR